jgi:hypothetical protein
MNRIAAQARCHASHRDDGALAVNRANVTWTSGRRALAPADRWVAERGLPGSIMHRIGCRKREPGARSPRAGPTAWFGISRAATYARGGARESARGIAQ